MKLGSAKYLFSQGVKNMWSNRVMGIASYCVLMVSLLLVGFSILFVLNIDRVVGGIENKNEVVIFLEDNVTKENIDEVGKKLEGLGNIETVSFYSKEQAFQDNAVNMLGEELLDKIDSSVYPDSYRVRVTDTEIISDTVDDIATIAYISSVRAPYDFANVLTGLKRIISLISATLIAALTIVSMVMISNTTRASVFARRKEISIMKYVGATNSFIRIPFFVEGLFTGILSGATAAAITWVAYDSLVELLTSDASLWSIIGVGTLLPFNRVQWVVVGGYICVGAVLGAIGSVISTTKHLRV